MKKIVYKYIKQTNKGSLTMNSLKLEIRLILL